MGTIYLITNKQNGKVYVGQTRFGSAKRWEWNRRAARGGSQVALHRAIRKYGEGAFTISTLETCGVECLDERETAWIEQLGSKSPLGYNQTAGGAGSPLPSDETRNKMSKSAKHRPPVAERTRALLRENFSRHADKMRRGNSDYRPHTSESKRKIGAASRGKVHSVEARRKISEAKQLRDYARLVLTWPAKQIRRAGAEDIRGAVLWERSARKSLSPSRQAVADGLRGKPRDPEVMARIAAANRGRTRSPEARQRMSEAAKRKPPASPETLLKRSAASRAMWAKRKAETA